MSIKSFFFGVSVASGFFTLKGLDQPGGPELLGQKINPQSLAQILAMVPPGLKAAFQPPSIQSQPVAFDINNPNSPQMKNAMKEIFPEEKVPEATISNVPANLAHERALNGME